MITPLVFLNSSYICIVVLDPIIKWGVKPNHRVCVCPKPSASFLSFLLLILMELLTITV